MILSTGFAFYKVSAELTELGFLELSLLVFNTPPPLQWLAAAVQNYRYVTVYFLDDVEIID